MHGPSFDMRGGGAAGPWRMDEWRFALRARSVQAASETRAMPLQHGPFGGAHTIACALARIFFRATSAMSRGDRNASTHRNQCRLMRVRKIRRFA
jgi:hypothetical protein